MRKSERIRLLELNVLKMQMEIEILHGAIATLIGMDPVKENIKAPDLDSGKWYNRKFPNN